LILAAAVASAAPALAADAFPASGVAKLAACSVCRSAVIVDMGPVGSSSSAECTGIVKTLDGSKILDNLAIRCIEEVKTRREVYAFSGTCVHTDGDGDKIFMTYGGSGKRRHHIAWRHGQVPGHHRQGHVVRCRRSGQHCSFSRSRSPTT
jgi:hypothetical protein